MNVSGDQALLKQAQAGDSQALQQLLERHQGQLYRFSMRMCGDPEDARDVLQESLLAAARSLPSFRGDASLSTWLYTIARSFCLKQQRRARVASKMQPLDSTQPLTDPAPAPEQQVADRELLGELERAILALDPGQREVLLLRDVEGLRAAEVAQVLQLSVPQVKSRLHRARAAVRDRLDRRLRERYPQPSMPPPAQCPDIVDTFSRYLEDEISPALCEQMQAHVDRCAHCRATCDSLKHTLAVCHALPTPTVPEPVQQALRDEMRKLAAGP